MIDVSKPTASVGASAVHTVNTMNCALNSTSARFLPNRSATLPPTMPPIAAPTMKLAVTSPTAAGPRSNSRTMKGIQRGGESSGLPKSESGFEEIEIIYFKEKIRNDGPRNNWTQCHTSSDDLLYDFFHIVQ